MILKFVISYKQELLKENENNYQILKKDKFILDKINHKKVVCGNTQSRPNN